MSPKNLAALLAAGAVVLAASIDASHASAREHADDGITKAIALLMPTKGSKVEGTVTFTKVDNGTRVVAMISGLAPGKHGFHIHEFGNATSPDGKAAGGHFNPELSKHAGPTDAMRHMGDLGNIEADDSGMAKLDRVDPYIMISGPTTILGRGLVVHEKADDLKSQPAGDAGGRLAVGVIGVDNPK